MSGGGAKFVEPKWATLHDHIEYEPGGLSLVHHMFKNRSAVKVEKSQRKEIFICTLKTILKEDNQPQKTMQISFWMFNIYNLWQQYIFSFSIIKLWYYNCTKSTTSHTTSHPPPWPECWSPPLLPATDWNGRRTFLSAWSGTAGWLECNYDYQLCWRRNKQFNSIHCFELENI